MGFSHREKRRASHRVHRGHRGGEKGGADLSLKAKTQAAELHIEGRRR